MKKIQADVVGHKVTLAYLGEPFAGWQCQPGKPTIQECLEKALERLWKQPIRVHGSGRTDTGVHALGQVASFEAPRLHAPNVLVRAINHNLPEGIRVLKVEWVPQEFHARFDAVGKTYEYRVFNAPYHDPFFLGRAWHVARPLDLAAMRMAARVLVGKHDFASFTSNPGYERATTVRTIRRFQVAKKGSWVTFRVCADGFLYRMVRNLVGALVRVGLGRLKPAEFTRILAAKKRSEAPATAPACGLYLVKVDYPPRHASTKASRRATRKRVMKTSCTSFE